MGLTLDELKLIKSILDFYDPDYPSKVKEGLRLIKREIKLKEMNPVTGCDVNGNPMEGGD